MLIVGCKGQRVWLAVIKVMSLDQIGHLEVRFKIEVGAEGAVEGIVKKAEGSCFSYRRTETDKHRAVLRYNSCALLSAAKTSEHNECVF
jgi:hypothetical protein